MIIDFCYMMFSTFYGYVVLLLEYLEARFKD
nr:MAG TPA: hypothetical protein [Caudoviricetes sp.]DAM86162.1 MAG TPA: hypothetical protein [Caudoviricetes sp.]